MWFEGFNLRHVSNREEREQYAHSGKKYFEKILVDIAQGAEGAIWRSDVVDSAVIGDR